jgi:Copper type II ascorbate-dependent monooxygenase, C-terminal domain
LEVVQPTFTIQPGDAFRTICNYDANRNETWGRASSEEMCIAFLYYYPRQIVEVPSLGSASFMCGVNAGMLLPGCDSGYTMTPNFSEVRQLGRIFGTAPEDGTCAAVPTLAPVSAPVRGSDAPSDAPSAGPNANSAAPSVGANATSAAPTVGTNVTSATPTVAPNGAGVTQSSGSNETSATPSSGTEPTSNSSSSTSTSAAVTTATVHFLGSTVLAYAALAMW